MMRTKKTARVTVTLARRKFSTDIEYDTLADLMGPVNEIVRDMEHLIRSSVIITLPECDGGRSYPWHTGLARQCFSVDGNLSEDMLADIIFSL